MGLQGVLVCSVICRLLCIQGTTVKGPEAHHSSLLWFRLHRGIQHVWRTTCWLGCRWLWCNRGWQAAYWACAVHLWKDAKPRPYIRGWPFWIQILEEPKSIWFAQWCGCEGIDCLGQEDRAAVWAVSSGSKNHLHQYITWMQSIRLRYRTVILNLLPHLSGLITTEGESDTPVM